MSAVAEVDERGRLVRVEHAGGDREVAELLPARHGLLVADAPLAVPNERGRRQIELLLAWCDIPAFPASRERLRKVHGGLRGPSLAPALARGGPIAETPPDLMLRQLAWERRAGPGRPDLADYRAAFVDVRPPRYRPRGRGRARPEGAREAADLLGDAVDLAGWEPAPEADDRAAILDAASLDAIAAAALAHRALRHPGDTLALAGGQEGPYLLPVDDALRERLRVHLERLRADGDITLVEAPSTGAPRTP